jgi:hypothetical protein
MRLLRNLLASPLFFPLILLLVCGASYGILIPWLGYYGDDLSMGWLAYKAHQIQDFFNENRPFWGYYYEITSRVLGPAPWHWQIYALLWRWVGTVAFWRLISLLWPQSKNMAAATALLFAVYPGFLMSSEAMTFNVHYVQLAVFLGSLIATLYSLRHPHRALGWTILAIAGTIFNLLFSEFFFFLELIRFAMIWFEQAKHNAQSLRPALRAELPYGIVFTAILLVRVFNIGGINAGHPIAIFSELKTAPFSTLLNLGSQIFADLTWTALASFGNVFSLPNLDGRSLPVVLAIVAGLLILSILTYVYLHHLESGESQSPAQIQSFQWQYLIAGGIGLLLAGGSIWIAGLPVNEDASSTRLSLPFMPGACLFLVGLISLIFRPLPKKGAYAMLIAFAIVFQPLTGLNFVRQGSIQESFLWQIAARLPTLPPGAILISNPRFLLFNGENATSALLNWMYTPDSKDASLKLYSYQNPDRIQKALIRLQSDQAELDHMIGKFIDRYVVAFDFRPPACLRILDPDLDPFNPALTPTQRQVAGLTDFATIQSSASDSIQLRPPREIFGESAPPQNWCSQFALAGLAAQKRDWSQVAQMGTRYAPPENPMERVIFIEGFAHQENWSQVKSWLEPALTLNPEFMPVFCRLKQRIQENTPPSSEREQALISIKCLQ